MNRRGRISDLQREAYARSGMLSVTQAAIKLGVSAMTVRRMNRAGTLTYARIGGRVVVPEKAVETFIAAQTRLGTVA